MLQVNLTEAFKGKAQLQVKILAKLLAGNDENMRANYLGYIM